MLYGVQISKDASQSLLDLAWYVGEPVPAPIGRICEIQADGDELEYILREFANLPYHKTRQVQRWFGDTAEFIYRNLRRF